MKIPVNGVSLYYEQYGEGPPFLLLHGNSETHEIFDRFAARLAQHYTVYAIDSRGHGRSSRVGNLRYSDMAEDVAAFIRELGLNRPILYGFSDGGIIGLLVAIQYPRLLSQVIASGANASPKGLKPWLRAAFRLNWRIRHDPLILMMLTQPNITAEQLRRIRIPVLLTAGSNDLVQDLHTAWIASQIPGCSLVTVRGEDHGSYIVHSDKIFEIIRPYLFLQ